MPRPDRPGEVAARRLLPRHLAGREQGPLFLTDLALNPPPPPHLAEAGVQLPILMAKSRHNSLISLAVYAQPTFDAVAAATAALDPDRRH